MEKEVKAIQHVVSFSGGRTSAYLVYLMEQNRKNLGWKVSYIFLDTGQEHPKTYDFIREMVSRWNIDLVCLRVRYKPLGEGNEYEVIPVEELKTSTLVWDGLLSKYGTPSIVMPFCTDRMKSAIAKKWCNATFGRKQHLTWLGIRSDEPKRLKERVGINYLAALSDFDKNDVLDWWGKQPFDLQIDEHLGNCVFCLKKGTLKLALAIKDEPELADRFIAAVSSPTVRPGKRERMYRGGLHLQDIRDLYLDTPRKDISSRLRHQKKYDTGSCSESCEAFIDNPKDAL